MHVNHAIVSGRVLHVGPQDGCWLGVLLCEDQYIPFRSSLPIHKDAQLVLQGRFCGIRDAAQGKVRSYLEVQSILPVEQTGSHSDDTTTPPPMAVPIVSESPSFAEEVESTPPSTESIASMEDDLVFTGPPIPWPT